MNNQISPDSSVQAVNANLVRDFLSKGDQQGNEMQMPTSFAYSIL